MQDAMWSSADAGREILWQPSDEQRERANITRYMRWLHENRGLSFGSYDDLWRWSVEDIEEFWASIWEFFGLISHSPHACVLENRSMPGARWFPGATVNYTEHALRRADTHPALIFRSERDGDATMTYTELRQHVAAAAAGLRRLGVRRGDRVVGFLPNVPETIVAFLATASIGATWSCCAPEFGVPSVVDRFTQIEPRVLIAVDGYRYNGQEFDRVPAVAEIVSSLPSLEATVLLTKVGANRTSIPGSVMDWSDLVAQPADLVVDPVPFDHPLWVLYSSGTTGLPKAIVHGHGGILLEHIRCLSLQTGLTTEDRFFWFSSTGWMMWNKLVSGLLLGCTVVLYDGSPAFPDMRVLWKYAEEARITYFGTSAPYLLACRKAGIEPGREFDLSRLRAIGSTGAPLPPEGFYWVYEAVKRDLLLGSTSGGTDLCTSFVGSCPILPVRAGEIQCRYLGAKVEAYDEAGQPVVDQVGELVLSEPLPSMPIFLWNDADGRRYHESYFDVYPGVWRHGDWIQITPRGSCVIYGRSDSTLNRGGVRMGTSEFYRVVEDLPEVLDSLVVDTSQLGTEGRLLLFVVLQRGTYLDDAIRARIAQELSRQISPRHVPNEIYAIDQVPRTLNGKKIEVPVKRILNGEPADRVVSQDAMSNPDSLAVFVDLATRLQRGRVL